MGALEFVVCPTIIGDQGHQESSAGSYSGKKNGIKPVLEHIPIHPRTLLGEVRKGARVTGGLEALGLLGLASHGNRNLVAPRSVVRQYEGDAVFRFHSLSASCLPSLALFLVRPIWDASML